MAQIRDEYRKQFKQGRKACTSCFGRGTTKSTRANTRRQDGKTITTALGSGCPECKGVGFFDE